MYKVLIVTKYFETGGSSVHSVVAEFTEMVDAEAAIIAVTLQNDEFKYHTATHAFRLYQLN